MQSEHFFGRSQNIKRRPECELHQIQRLLIFIQKKKIAPKSHPEMLGKYIELICLAEILKF